MRKIIEKAKQEKISWFIIVIGIFGILQITGLLNDIRGLYQGASTTEILKIKSFSIPSGMALIGASLIMYIVSKADDIGEAISKVRKK